MARSYGIGLEYLVESEKDIFARAYGLGTGFVTEQVRIDAPASTEYVLGRSYAVGAEYVAQGMPRAYAMTASYVAEGLEALATLTRSFGLTDVYVGERGPVRSYGTGLGYVIEGVTGGSIKAFTGSVWTLKPLKMFTGGSWVLKPLKRWSGTAWV